MRSSHHKRTVSAAVAPLDKESSKLVADETVASTNSVVPFYEQKRGIVEAKIVQLHESTVL